MFSSIGLKNKERLGRRAPNVKSRLPVSEHHVREHEEDEVGALLEDEYAQSPY